MRNLSQLTMKGEIMSSKNEIDKALVQLKDCMGRNFSDNSVNFSLGFAGTEKFREFIKRILLKFVRNISLNYGENCFELIWLQIV